MSILNKIAILVIDDESDICEIIKEELEMVSRDLECDIVFSGQDAIQKLQEKKYHIVLTDIKIPDISGLEIIQYAKKELREKPVFIVMTGYSTYSKEDIKKIGVLNLFQKPNELSNIIDCIQELFFELRGCHQSKIA